MPLGIHKKLQNAATAGNGTAVQLDAINRSLTFYIIGSAGVGAGAVQIEHAHDKDYTGTWAPLGAPITVAVSSVLALQIDGAFGAVRARISTTVTGGTVTVEIFGNVAE